MEWYIYSDILTLHMYSLLKKKHTFISSNFTDDPGSGSVTLDHAQLFNAPRSNSQEHLKSWVWPRVTGPDPLSSGKMDVLKVCFFLRRVYLTISPLLGENWCFSSIHFFHSCLVDIKIRDRCYIPQENPNLIPVYTKCRGAIIFYSKGPSDCDGQFWSFACTCKFCPPLPMENIVQPWKNGLT